jgi:hypothetical protein
MDARVVQHMKINNVLYQINRIKNEKNIILIDAEKAFNKIQHTFMIKKKNSQQIKYRRKAPHIIKNICDKPITNITLNRE